MRTSNPALSDRFFGAHSPPMGESSTRMTLEGTAQKAAILMACCFVTGAMVWAKFTAGESVMGWMMLGAIGGLGVAILTVFKQEWAPYTAPAYALLEGLFLGGISASFNAQFPGIAIQAFMLTMGTAAVLLFAFSKGYIQVNDKFRAIVIGATGAIMLVYVVSMLLGFFGIQVPLIHGNGIIGIGFSLIVVGVAALNLCLDYDLIGQGVERGAPKHMEWYGAFALMVTLVWLYIEFLRLLAKLRSR